MGEQVFESGLMGRIVAGSVVIDRWRLERLREVAELETTRSFRCDGYTSVLGFLVHRTGMGAGEAARTVFVSRQLEAMPYTVKLVEAGDLSVNQLEVLARVASRHPDQYCLDEMVLADSVAGLGLADTRRVVDYWCQAHCDPQDQPPDQVSRVYLSKTLDGRGRLDGDLDPQTRVLLETALGTMMDEIVETTPRAELGTASEIRAEALAELARRHLDDPDTPTDHGNRPHLTVVIDWQVLTGQVRSGASEYLDGTVITPDHARMLACDANICRLLTGPNSEILDLGRTRRTVTPAQWRALRIRDRHCQWAGCRRPHTWCDAHHLDPWYPNGETNLNRLILLCRHHHTLSHRAGWTIRGSPGQLTITRPDGTVLGERSPP